MRAMRDYITYESPLELLLETQAEIEKDIEWAVSRLNTPKGTLQSKKLQQLRLKSLKASNREYTAAIERLTKIQGRASLTK